ncbi:uncharacterized protein KY384_002739 [Bacidia gigantensis]|uniref:uncharacterized protein n=1 Tax=Bacidia gigantensis TaxID=2732470 RepID=UPI001D03C19D|nr:uncharacterized protein KY384_002739 [Bacidia gigantensis]KAG8532861.1 hypothetical protein KY384_002739 [Bacidia gigantensis]
MDFPNDLSTNCHEISGIFEVVWKLFNLASNESDWDESDEQLILLQAECQFRIFRWHSIIDVEHCGLWVFAFSSNEDEKILKLAHNLGLTLASHGCIKASELGNLNPLVDSEASSLHSPAFDPYSINDDSFDHNGTVQSDEPIAKADDDAETPALSAIYIRFIEATRRSIAFTLAQQPGWLLFNNNTCLNEQSLGFSALHPPNTTEVLTVKSEWTALGSLLLRVVAARVPKLHKISELLKLDNHSLFINLPVLMTPLGLWGLVRSIEAKDRYQRRSPKYLKRTKSLRKYLDTFGLLQTQDTSWLTIELQDTLARRQSNSDLKTENDYDKVEIFWPADCCFCLDLKCSNKPSDNQIMDPIARAESWYNARHEREKVLVDRKRAEVAAQRMNANKEAIDRDVVNALSPLDPRANLQDASGFYPTPPDGIQSQANNTPAQDEITEPTVQDGHQAFRDPHYGYHGADDHEMFGDHDMGLTEEDLEFFNEPGEENTSATLADFREDVKQEVFEITQGDQGTPKESENIAIQDVEILHEAETDTQDWDYDRHHFLVNDPSSSVSSITGLATKRRETSLSSCENQQTASAETKPNVPQKPQSIWQEDFQHAEPPHEEKLDQKYSVGGRFDFAAIHERSSKQRDSKHQMHSDIPKIGLQDGSASDTEDTYDQDEVTTSSSSDFESDSDDDMYDSSILEKSSKLQNTTPSPEPTQKGYRLKRNSKFPTPDLFRHVLNLHSSLKDPFVQETHPTPITAASQAFIQHAQIMTDQALTTSRSKSVSDNSLFQKPPPVGAAQLGARYSAVTRIVEFWFPTSRCLDLRDFIGIKKSKADLRPAARQDLQLQPLPYPDMTIRRMGMKMDMLPSALPFWEELSLEPLHGQKDVVAFCFSSDQQTYLDRPITRFMRMMRDAYQGCNLGRHRLVGAEHGQDTALPPQDYSTFGAKLAETFARNDTLIVYILNQKSDFAAPTDLCAGAMELLEGYRSVLAAKSTQDPPDLVIQFVPLGFIFDTRFVVTPPLGEYRRLAFEVYDRCGPPKDAPYSKPPYMPASAFALSQEMPAQIDLQLSSDSSVAKLYEDDCLHIAYAWKPAEPWLTVSWSDNTGNLQWTAAHWLGEEFSDVWQAFIDTVDEILETTLEMLDPRNRPWQIFIAKEKHFYVDELECKFVFFLVPRIPTDIYLVWEAVISNLGRSKYRFYFMTVDAEPDLQCSVPMAAPEESNTMDQPLTPVSTPNAAANSPDVTTAATPSGQTAFDNDPDTRLVDARDEAWRCIVGAGSADHCLPTSYCLPLSSGYIIKRAGVSDVEGVMLLAVSLMKPDDETLLLGVLEMYHKLATLARMRGLTDTVTGMLPIHIASARKAFEAVHSSLRLGNGEG